ncbi:phosphotriesterase family protein [Nesterenkonia sandarakina]|uniref:Phosphotriesterase-related protein n=1 Tax=Nesterenkonia sandarakina TaxID=272918 RepID=A0A2T0YRN5_9MICC|nr:phosphotriesterase-related protein [Nesterenkonia sandarakina]PRZ18218.1 phosphotriesterase-related protein [Nesterenkonia sandarakina]
MSSMIPTLTGEVSGAQLGTTLVHEHLIVGDPQLDRDLPHPEWDAEAVMAAAEAQLQGLSQLGVETIVDLTVPGLGRDVRRVAELARRTSVRILAATGWYTSDVLPHFFHLNGPGRLVEGPDPLLRLFLGDIQTGIAGTELRAAIIKVCSDKAGITDDVAQVFTAAAQAHRITGVPITTHSDPSSRGGLDQQRLLGRLGVDLTRVVIGHSGDSTDLEYLKELARAGSFLGFDRFGMRHTGSDEDRIRMLLALLELGFEDQLLLSHDAAVFSRITPPSWRAVHAPHWRMDHLHRRILPRLRAQGMDSALEHRLMVENPRRMLTGA